MWRRLRRRSMAPSRPIIYPEQLGLVLLTVAIVIGGIYVAVRTFLG